MDSDGKIIKQVLEGDCNAFEGLISKYYAQVYKVCRGFMGNDQDAMDMSQEVFIKLYNNLGRFRHQSSLFTWIYRICTNTCLTELQKTGRLKTCPTEECSLPEDGTASFEEALELKELVKIIEDKLNDMGRVAAAIMRMRLFGREKFKDIAGKLGIASSTATSMFTRSKRDLQKAIDNYNKEAE